MTKNVVLILCAGASSTLSWLASSTVMTIEKRVLSSVDSTAASVKVNDNPESDAD